ncbi:MAG: GNAT family N-acetyltransferase [Gemmatimonadaceae bacterium]
MTSRDGSRTDAEAARSVAVRQAGITDAATLAELGARTFRDAFAAYNTATDLAGHLANTYGVAHQHRELADPAVVTLLAERSGVSVGYALLRRGAAPDCVTGPVPFEVARLYAEQAELGRGVGPALMREVLAVAERLGAQTLWLSTWERNPRALRFYAKHGFQIVGSRVFLVGTDAQRDYVLARPVVMTGD